MPSSLRWPIRIARRLHAQKQGIIRAGDKSALVLVKADIVARGMRELGIRLEPGPSRKRRYDVHASQAGMFAGANVDLSNPYKIKRPADDQ